MNLVLEKHLRLYKLCNKRYKYSKNEDLFSFESKLLEKAFEYLFVQNLEGYPFDHLDNTELLNKALNFLASEESLTPSEYQNYAIKGNSLFDQLLKTITIKKYIAISGPIDVRVKANKYVFQLHLSGIARTEEGSLRAWAFSPYSLERDISWDLIHGLQFSFLKQFSQEQSISSIYKPLVYVIYLTGKMEPKITSIRWAHKDFKSQLKQFEENFSFSVSNNIFSPTIPCVFPTCPYRRECLPNV